MDISYDLAKIQTLTGAKQVEGAFAGNVRNLASLKDATSESLSFLGNKKYTPEVGESQAGIILVPDDFDGAPKDGQAFLRVPNPSLALARVCGEIESRLWPWPAPAIHASAVIDPDASVEASACIGPGCVIEAGASIGAGTWLQAQTFVGRGARIGEKCWIRPHVAIHADCQLGDRVSVHAGTVIGSDGFGYETQGGVHEKVPQIGNVIIENDVEIGANTTIDRARFSSTRICEGAKIDNLVQIAHNVVIGPHCLVVAQAGVSGSTTLDRHVVIAGQAGITGHLKLAAGTIVGAQGGVHFDTEPGKYYRGSPALEAALANRIHILSKRLPELFRRIDKIEEAVKGSLQS